LLDKQQAEQLTEAERPEVLALMHLSGEGPLLKAQALREAVRRGLREPLGSRARRVHRLRRHPLLGNLGHFEDET
jgi:hypothetical protein